MSKHQNSILSEIKDLTNSLYPRLVEIRRHLHAHPELSGQEYQTSAYIAGVLSSCGLHVQEAVGKTGVVGELKGTGNNYQWLAIRTDMDALPIQELTNLEYASRHPGVMHACGHDVHTTVGLGTAMVLSRLQDSLPGAVRFLFQPAEEIARGSTWMVEDGVMNDVISILGLHVFPTIPAGCIGMRVGALTAAADDLELTILGESGHGARPHEAIDAIWIAAQVITTLQQAISRTHNPLRPVVLTIGQITGGRASNVIADQVKLLGTVRSLHQSTYETLPAWIENIVANVCQTYGAKYQMNYRRGVPSVQNDPALTQLIEASVREAWGNESLEILPEPSLGAEDFSVYLNHAPGAMFRLGIGHRDQPNYPLHHPKFQVDESAIKTGVVSLAYSAYQFWQKRCQ
ncbi:MULTISPECIES: M20 family metallopeptidase [Arthrospira]|jgi:amidohydrolase|uniref:N-acyl-L-amino acid amidohydrolase n=1 Tax=Limnospira platensis NIES-46 TaxID=1236695 RepID=A0A5M3T952_LIMPL|nr:MULTISPECIES: M20 family metallopeptidase [Arthrospira]AMW28721.1 hydrolase [Arthrospira platensis YZ]KDR56219.1 hydrolase [Arthrospira platensis str. Paraca]MBD2670385.1 amidohydrolase [Arthrospira platensis FACHB-439]MBD2712121.1 amidohydrolase [Arthrospira platensis FACHB-835]MDF2210424.1 M20 family metallopeptidase [Arthrospira platensis NCB002]MDT9183562.1 M20 family metallopeptidase [Limnospira sp. PMC 289.06]MDT9295560.1 M20 family metallopeptidase [Arthrospira platensis PCC 7345]